MLDNSQSSSRQENLGNHISQPLALTPELWSAAVPYLPGILLDEITRQPERNSPWIDSVEGSLIFADISGFTTMSEKLAESGKEGAEWLTEFINTYFQTMLDISREYDGTNLKFGGDALLLLFRGDNHAMRAVTAALGMKRATRRYSNFKAGNNRFHIGMTIGIHSGNFWFAVAGIPGIRMQDFILGKQTSYVAEVEAAAMGSELLVSQATYDLLEGNIISEAKGDFHLVTRLFKKIPLNSFENGVVNLPPATDELLSYLPPPIIQLIQSDITYRGIEGLHRKVSVIFINVRGVNDLLENHKPEVLLGELQQYVALVIELAEKYSGFLVSNDVSSSGIKLIILFGAPVAHEQDSANAFRFAIELNHTLPHLNINHQIGINNGFVFAGDIGSTHRRQYTVMGDAVNLAARLMSSAKLNQILVSEQVAKEAGTDFVITRLPSITVKGKRDPIQIGSLEEVKQTYVLEQSQQEGALFGRETEVNEFKSIWGNIERGKGRTVLISGDAGIGKSRLAQHFQRQLTEWKCTTCGGACYSHTAGKPFAPWIHILSSFFGLAAKDEPGVKNEKVLSAIQRLCPGSLEIAPLFNPLLGLTIPPSPLLESLDDKTRRARLFELITDLLTAATAENPLAIFIDNLHWADHSSLELINSLSVNVNTSRLLLCLTQRPKDNPDLKLSTDAVHFELGELSDKDALQMIEHMLDVPEFPEQLAIIIISKGKGNPLFLLEIMRTLKQSGNLERILGATSLSLAKEMASLEIPDRIQSLIMSRIDALSESGKELLRIASVVGYTFEPATIKMLVDPIPNDTLLSNRLQELERFDLINPEEGYVELTYQFKQNLIQEVAYQSLLFARRRELHHRVAAFFEESYSNKLEGMYEVLVHHYSYSRDDVKTRFFANKAADKARSVFAHQEAIEYYQLGINTLHGIDPLEVAQRSYFIEKISDSYEGSGQHSEAARNYSKALRHWTRAYRKSFDLKALPDDLSQGAPVKNRASVLRHKMAVSCERNSDYDLALKQLELSLKELPPRQPSQMAKIIVTKSLSFFRKGLYKEAIYWGRLGLSLARRSGDLHDLAYAYNILASSYLDVGNIKKAIKYRESVIHFYDQLGNVAGLAQAHNNLGASFQALGDQNMAFHHFNLSLGMCERVGNFTNTAIANNNVGEVLLTLGKLDESIDHLNKVVETFEEKGDPLAACGLALVNMSRAYQNKRDFEQAFSSLNRGIELLRKARARGLLAEALLQQAELQLATSQTEQSVRTCNRVLKDTQELGLKLLEARGLHIMGRVNAVNGFYKEGENCLKQSMSLANSINADYEKGVALMHLATLYSMQKLNKTIIRRCLTAINKAAVIFKRVGAVVELKKVLNMKRSLVSSV